MDDFLWRMADDEMAAIDGGKPIAFTQNLLNQYENGQVSSSQLKQAIVEKYTRVSQ